MEQHRQLHLFGLSKALALTASLGMALFYVAILYAPTLVLRLPPPASSKNFILRRFICASISSGLSLLASALLLPRQALLFPFALTSLTYAGSIFLRILLLLDSWRDRTSYGGRVFLRLLVKILQWFVGWASVTASNVLAWRNYVIIRLSKLYDMVRNMQLIVEMITDITEGQDINSFSRLESLKEVYGVIWGLFPILTLVLGITLGVLVIVWLEREIASGIQQRIGPEYAGPLGILQSLADGTKLLFKENLFPSRGDTRLFSIGPSNKLLFIISFSLFLGANFPDFMHWEAPLTEEVVFRACMIPLLLCGGFKTFSIVLLCPIIFSSFEPFCGDLQQTKLQLGQRFNDHQYLGYSDIWVISFFLFIRTGNLIAPLVAHVWICESGNIFGNWTLQ